MRRWFFLTVAVTAGCGVRFASCDQPPYGEDLPVKLYMCSARNRRCEVVARFHWAIDCDTYLGFLGSECDPDAGPGVLLCRQTNLEIYRREWFHECTERDLAFDDVRDGGGWIR